MTLFTVHPAPDRMSPPMLVAHRFCWPAFLFGPLWLATKRIWIPASIVLLVDLVVLVLARRGHLDGVAAMAIVLVVAALIGLEAGEWRRRSVTRKGRQMTCVALGSDEIDALGRLDDRRRLAEARP